MTQNIKVAIIFVSLMNLTPLGITSIEEANHFHFHSMGYFA